MTIHEPVLLREVLSYLKPGPNQNFVDCTFGGGGHSLAIWEKIKPHGKLIGIDWDSEAVANSQQDNLILVNDNYKNLRQIIHDVGFNQVDGLLLDLGLSSDQLGRGDRGFGFESQGILDLRYDRQGNSLTAADILRTYSQEELVKIFREYGEEPLAWPIAKKIIANREQGQTVETAEMLVQLVSQIYGRHFRTRSKKNPATRVFQALRIAVNDEFNNLKQFLPQAVEALASGGRLVVISFHSGEDRIVKNFFREGAKREEPRFKIITKKPVVPTAEEIEKNPRSRSAKLRVIEKI